MADRIAVFDGHNDFLLRLLGDPARRDAIWLKGEGKGHLDLSRMRAGNLIGGFFAVFIPSPRDVSLAAMDKAMETQPYDLPLPAPVALASAQPIATAMIGQLMWMERTGTLSICRSVADIRAAVAAGRIAAILHFEGAEAIDKDLDALHLWHAAGLRSIGPVWSRPTIFGHGVPFRFPSGPDTGPGLTEAGKRLIRECNKLRIMVDLSHMNEKGFDDVAAISSAPLVATHSNAHAITPLSRNLTDRQLNMIRDTDGIVGLNFGNIFLSPDGRIETITNWEPILRHLDHLIGRLGEDRVGFGSDFDGTSVPAGIGDAAGLPNLMTALSAHGYSDALLRKLAHENWFALLERTWGR